MAKRIDQEKLLKAVKKCVIGLVTIAILVFLYMSVQIFNLSTSDPDSFRAKFRQLSSTEKSMVKSMKKTGEVQSKFMGPSRSTGGNGKFIEEVEKKHKKDRKKK